MKKTERIFTPMTNAREFVEKLAARGEHTLFRYPEGTSFASMDYGTFAARVRAAAAGLFAMGLGGARVAVIGETSPEWIATYLAVLAGGGVIVPMDKELDIEEIGKFLAGVGAQAVVFGHGFAEKFAPAVKDHPTLQKFISMRAEEVSEPTERLITFDALLAAGEAALASGYTFPERDPQALAVMLFTSGTTGTSKCVMLSEHNIVTAVNAACASVNFGPDDVTLSVLPVHHTYEMTIMLSSLNYGFTVGINDSLRHLMRNLKEIRPTALILVPLFVTTMYDRIFAEAKKKGRSKLLSLSLKASDLLRVVKIDLRARLFHEVLGAFGGHLSKIICGGAPLNPDMVKKFDAFGVQICEGYGITECSPLIAVTPYYAPKPGSVGPTVPDCEARIAGEETNSRGYIEGEIQVRGGNVMLGYYENDAENAKAFTEDGWYRTGDVGYMDEDGYIYITGRMKSVIVLENGKNVFPEEIEEYLARIPEVAEAVVVGRKQQDSDTVDLTAIVYPNRDAFAEGTGREEVYGVIYQKILALDKKLPSFKKIKALELRDTEFPKTTSKKIKRHLVQ